MHLLKSSLPLLFLLCGMLQSAGGQALRYEISFPNALRHEARVKAVFPGLQDRPLEVRMSRTSPGRYALHEFAKNVYLVKATDKAGNPLDISRPDPYSWLISGHDGEVQLEYTLFADRGDGTYSQIDETHAHLNIPATFMFAPAYGQRPIEVTFRPREDLGWKVATQLEPVGDNTFRAPDLDYFMDSPTELSDFELQSFKVGTQEIRLVLHSEGPAVDLEEFMERKIKGIVTQQAAVFGGLPAFDYGTYTFLYCVGPRVSGDGMEHRNSTVISSGWEAGGEWWEQGGGTSSHEFFHAWNVERIRPLSLQPFDYEAANMSGELWFAEGFTSYYTNLIRCRAGIISPKEYVEGLAGAMNYVWNSPGRLYHNVIEMSYQAPFVDAAQSIDPTNRANTFVSYYSYGSVLGLALDLSLRQRDEALDLDGFMQLMWEKYGQAEIPYTVRDLENTLSEYAGQSFAQAFFDQYIYRGGMPEYATLFAGVGVGYGPREPDRAMLGLYLGEVDGFLTVDRDPTAGSTGYRAGISAGDRILSVAGITIDSTEDLREQLTGRSPGDILKMVIERNGVEIEVDYELAKDPTLETYLLEERGETVSAAALERRKAWLEAH